MSTVQQNPTNRLKERLKAAISRGYKGYKTRQNTDIKAPGDLINCVTGAVTALMDQEGMSLADAGIKLKMEQLQRDIEEVSQAKSRMAKAHQRLAIRLGIYGRKDGILDQDAWYIWVNSQNGYLLYSKKQDALVVEDEQGGLATTEDSNQAYTFISEEAVLFFINNFVPAHLRASCLPTQKRG